MKEKKTYSIEVDYEYGPSEIYRVEAYSASEAKKKAKAIYIKDYFKSSYLNCSVL